MHSFTLSVSHTVFHFLNPPPPVLGDWGVSCNLSVGFSLASMVTCSIISIPFLFRQFCSLFLALALTWLAPFSRSCSQALLLAGFPARIICVFAACLWQGSFAGRKAGWWPLRSPVTQVRCKQCPWGACVSLSLWNAREHQFSILTLPQKLMQRTLGKGQLSDCTYVIPMVVIAAITDKRNGKTSLFCRV